MYCRTYCTCTQCVLHTQRKSGSLCLCAMCLLYFVMCHVCRGVLCTVCVYWTSVEGSREIWWQPILILPALSKTSLWNNHYGAKNAFVMSIYHFGIVTKSFSSDLMLSSNVFWREDKGILLDHWWGRSSMRNCLFLAYISKQLEFYHSHKFNIDASPSTLKGRISHWKFIGQSLSKLLQ